jgi:hypothetical protein
MSGSGNLLTIADVRANTPLGSAARSRWVKKLKAVEGMVPIRCSLVGRLRIAESNRRSCGRRCHDHMRGSRHTLRRQDKGQYPCGEPLRGAGKPEVLVDRPEAAN